MDVALALLVAAAIFVSFTLLPSFAWAADPVPPRSAIAEVLCGIIFIFTGGLGILLSVIAISILGLTAALGRVSWPVALTTAVGISIIFGAGDIVGMFGQGGGCSNMPAGFKATDAPAIHTVFCRIFAVMQGSVGASLATIAVCMLGFGAMLGKVQWSTALTVTIGLIVLFSASSILTVMYARNGGLGGLGVAYYLEHMCGRPISDFGYFSQSLCTLAGFISGKRGVAVSVISTICVLIMAFSAMFGRISWGTALSLGSGIGLVLGSAFFVGQISSRNIACTVYAASGNAKEIFDLSIRTKSGTHATQCVDSISGAPMDCAGVDLMVDNGSSSNGPPGAASPGYHWIMDASTPPKWIQVEDEP